MSLSCFSSCPVAVTVVEPQSVKVVVTLVGLYVFTVDCSDDLNCLIVVLTVVKIVLAKSCSSRNLKTEVVLESVTEVIKVNVTKCVTK